MMKWAFASMALWQVASVVASRYDEPNEGTGLSTHQELRIYGGDEADASQFPFIAGLRKSSNGTTYCGAALVAPEYLLTAAHCVKETDMYASLGSKYGSGERGGERIKIAESFVHPQYVKKDHLYDFAVMKLESPASYKPVSLCSSDGSDHTPGTMAHVRGWGMTEDDKASDVMLEVGVKIITNEECNKQYNNRIKEHMVCAGEDNGKDTCQGDSGGPLLVDDKLVGVVSWGGKCGEQAGVYTRITHVLDFIKQHTGLEPPQPATKAPEPTPAPTETPAPKTVALTMAPTSAPTQKPSPTTSAPTEAPTESPSDSPAQTSVEPVHTPAPSSKAPVPTSAPTKRPTPEPKQTSQPTSAPTPCPSSSAPEPTPSTSSPPTPTAGPTHAPSTLPTPYPSVMPSAKPTAVPVPSTVTPTPAPSTPRKDRCETKDEDDSQSPHQSH